MENNTVDLTKRNLYYCVYLPTNEFCYTKMGGINYTNNPNGADFKIRGAWEDILKYNDASKYKVIEFKPFEAVNNYDSLLEHLRAVTYEYEVALKLLAEAGSFAFYPNQNSLILNSKAAIKKAEQ